LVALPSKRLELFLRDGFALLCHSYRRLKHISAIHIDKTLFLLSEIMCFTSKNYQCVYIYILQLSVTVYWKNRVVMNILSEITCWIEDS